MLENEEPAGDNIKALVDGLSGTEGLGTVPSVTQRARDTWNRPLSSAFPLQGGRFDLVARFLRDK